MGPHQGRVEGKENLPRPACHTLLDARQDTTGLLGIQGTLLAHGQPVVHQHSQVPLHRAALQQVPPTRSTTGALPAAPGLQHGHRGAAATPDRSPQPLAGGSLASPNSGRGGCLAPSRAANRCRTRLGSTGFQDQHRRRRRGRGSDAEPVLPQKESPRAMNEASGRKRQKYGRKENAGGGGGVRETPAGLVCLLRSQGWVARGAVTSASSNPSASLFILFFFLIYLRRH